MTETTNIFLAFELDNLNILINKNGTTPLFNNEKIFCKNSYKITNEYEFHIKSSVLDFS